MVLSSLPIKTSDLLLIAINVLIFYTIQLMFFKYAGSKNNLNVIKEIIDSIRTMVLNLTYNKIDINDFIGLTKDLPYKRMVHHCGFDNSPKEGMIRYLKEHNADLAITLTKEKHGLAGYFSSSFTDHLVDHAPCNVFVIR